MLSNPMDVLHQFPVRKNKHQKQAFRSAVTQYAASLGYPVSVEQSGSNIANVVIGDPDDADILITAHYDTCARLPISNFITPCSALFFIAQQAVITLALIAVAVAMGFAAGQLNLGSLPAVAITVLTFWALLALMLIGPANPSNANDNTSGVVTVLELMRTLPEPLRKQVCFVLFDLEEAGLLGSNAYRKAHKAATDRQTVLNLDCVGDGDELLFFPTKALRRSKARMSLLYSCCGYFGSKSLLVRDKGFGFYPSDQMCFPYGAGIAALKRRKKLLYLDRIHTPRDTSLDQTNVNILRAALTTLVSRTAAKKG